MDAWRYRSDVEGELRDEPEDEDNSEEDREADDAASEPPEVDALGALTSGGDEAGEGEDDAEEMVTEAVRIGRRIEREESNIGAKAQLEASLELTCLPSCPICLVPWTPDGPHRVCCIPCGHVFGRSCLERWLKHCKKNVAKCPQCSARFKHSEIINLYAPVIAVPSTSLESVDVLSLFEKNEALRLERDIFMEEINKSKKMACFEVASSGAMQRRPGPLDEIRISVTESLLENRLNSRSYQVNPNGIGGFSEIYSRLDQLESQVTSHEERISRLEASVDWLQDVFALYAQRFDSPLDVRTRQNSLPDGNPHQNPPTSENSPQNLPTDDDVVGIPR